MTGHRKTTARAARPLPPAIVLGGDVNALSVARSLGRAGIRVYALNDPSSAIRFSRYSEWIELPSSSASPQEEWAAFLLDPSSEHLRGAVLLASNDEAVDTIIKHREALQKKFTLDLSNPAAQRCMLNKLCTYRAARAAGVPTPRFWISDSFEDVERVKDELVYPLIVKPQYSHEFRGRFSGKFVVVRDYAQLKQTFNELESAEVKTLLVEKIPGPDSRLCSYYTYIDENGTAVFDFTKRMIRRFPINMGGGSYHVTDTVDGVKKLSLRLFRQVGLIGIAMAEFILDERDGELKLIECNARFTAGDPLLVASGLNLGVFVYRRLIGQEHRLPTSFRQGLHLWHPQKDYHAFRELRRRGELDWMTWLRHIFRPQVLPVFKWDDPWPSVRLAAGAAGKHLTAYVRKARAVLRDISTSPGSLHS